MWPIFHWIAKMALSCGCQEICDATVKPVKKRSISPQPSGKCFTIKGEIH